MPEILSNPPDRCYYCKKFLFEKLAELANQLGRGIVMDGTNADDLNEFRPGLRALRELSVCSPLAESGITKAQVRQMAAEMGLETASRPSAPCLATRLPYGTKISKGLLQKIEAGEAFLKDLGFPVLRLRVHPAADGGVARIEVPADRLEDLLMCRETIIPYLKELGFAQVTLDLEGFRSGSYDEILKRKL